MITRIRYHSCDFPVATLLFFSLIQTKPLNRLIQLQLPSLLNLPQLTSPWFLHRERERERGEREMSSLGTGKGLLEIGKFAVYVAVPVALTYAVATENKAFQKIMGLVRSFSISPFSFHFLYV
jgi:hypothetical protein